ncbi:MAG TPA: hypothetical protein VIO11_01815, partial [Candidatus Methanoperedens sp.]
MNLMYRISTKYLTIGLIFLFLVTPTLANAQEFTKLGQFPGGATYVMAGSGDILFTATGSLVESWKVTNAGITPINYMVWPGTNEIRPQKIGELSFGDYAVGGLEIVNNHLYVSTEKGLAVADISDPSNPVIINTYYKESYGYIKAVNGRLYASSEFYFYENPTSSKFVIFDISDPNAIKELGKFVIPISQGTLNRFAVSGNYAYLPVGYDIKPGYVFVVDISNPANPVEVARITGIGYAGFSSVGVDESRKILFALEYRSVLHAYDISNPKNPVELGHVGSDSAEPLGQASDMQIKGNYAYFSAFYEGIRIMDISDPSKMSHVSKGLGSSR